MEVGVPVHAVAAWAGHKDGGALILRTYAHLRSDFSTAMAQRVTFRRQPADTNLIAMPAVKEAVP